MDQEEKSQPTVDLDSIEFGEADVPEMNDPDSLELRRASDHDHFWVPKTDPLRLHPNRRICVICKMEFDENMQTQPWAPEPRFPRVGY